MFKISFAAARVNAGMTIDEVAGKMHRSKSTIIAWEKGKSVPDIYDYNKLCELYNVPKDCIRLSEALQKVENKIATEH